jgi:hypothetical protein
MLTTILSIILFTITLALGLRYRRAGEGRSWQFTRAVAGGLSALLIAIMSNSAVAAEQLMFAAAGGIIVREIFFMNSRRNAASPVTRLIRWLPVMAIVVFIWPYWTYLTYFFGYDRAVLFFGFILAAAYAVLASASRSRWHPAAHFTVLLSSLVMLVWLSVISITQLV